MKFVDMFCGVGTIRMGMEKAGHECVYSIEWDKWKRKQYGIIFGDEPKGADICDTRASDIPRSDIWVFGAPCQDFSIAGQRKGLEGNRSSLIREVFRLLRETSEEDRPKYIIYENVKGMLSSNKGLDFLEILYQMGTLGYDRREWQLLNSKNFGVPQNRERVFIIGHLRERSTRKIFPIGGNSQPSDIEIIGSTKGENCTRKGNRDLVYSVDGIMGCISATDYKQPKQIMVKGMLNIKGQENIRRVYDPNGLSPCLTTMEGGNRQPKIEVRAVLTPNRLEKRQNGRRMKEPGEPMFTLTKQDQHGVMITKNYIQWDLTGKGYKSQDQRAYFEDGIHGTLPSKGAGSKCKVIQRDMRIRRLTSKEYWRLQGIDDVITNKIIQAGISDTQMYRAAGDGCTVNVIYEIAKRL